MISPITEETTTLMISVSSVDDIVRLGVRLERRLHVFSLQFMGNGLLKSVYIRFYITFIVSINESTFDSSSTDGKGRIKTSMGTL